MRIQFMGALALAVAASPVRAERVLPPIDTPTEPPPGCSPEFETCDPTVGGGGVGGGGGGGWSGTGGGGGGGGGGAPPQATQTAGDPERRIESIVQAVDCWLDDRYVNRNDFALTTQSDFYVNLYVDQPIADSETVWTGPSGLGHVSIGLEQVIRGGQSRELTVGAYPEQGVTLNSGRNGMQPDATGHWYYDDGQSYDVRLRVRVSPAGMQALLSELLRQGDNLPYHIEANDAFLALEVVQAAGIFTSSFYQEMGRPNTPRTIIGRFRRFEGVSAALLGQRLRNAQTNSFSSQTAFVNGNGGTTPSNALYPPQEAQSDERSE
ncbi:MAG TPA: hypothetical protein RMG45_00115 [Polyangiaceae bacterium LLY-WYZ-15_(1-7)]|nr:hypothetical protein [Polyangiaceae bacterium LLY-WYZ-15_(1-7)]